MTGQTTDRQGAIRRILVINALRAAETTQAAVARRLGVSRGQVGNVLAGRRRSDKIEKRLAALAGMPARQLFGPKPKQSRARS